MKSAGITGDPVSNNQKEWKNLKVWVSLMVIHVVNTWEAWQCLGEDKLPAEVGEERPSSDQVSESKSIAENLHKILQ